VVVAAYAIQKSCFGASGVLVGSEQVCWYKYSVFNLKVDC